MTIKTDYAIQRMAEWSANKILSNCTPGKALETYFQAIGMCAKHGLNLEDAEREFGYLKSPELAAEYERQNLPKAMSGLERVALGQSDIFKLIKKNIPKGVFSEYVAPIMEHAQVNMRFLDCIREKAERNFPNPVSDKEIDECWKVTYGTVDRYLECVNGLMRANAVFLSLAAQNPNTTEEERRKALRVVNMESDLNDTISKLARISYEPLEVKNNL